MIIVQHGVVVKLWLVQILGLILVSPTSPKSLESPFLIIWLIMYIILPFSSSIPYIRP